MNEDNNNAHSNYLKELKIWLCASLKNSEATLVCESIKKSEIDENELSNIILALNETITKLQQIINILQNLTKDIEKNPKNEKRCKK